MGKNLAESPVVQSNPKRPVGVWILAIYAFLFAGLFPLVVEVIFIFSGNIGASALLQTILLSMPISLGNVFASIFTWKGNNTSRIILMICVTLHYGLVAWNNGSILLSGQYSPELSVILLARILRGFVFPAIYILYFSLSTTRKFFQKRYS
jgi:hypothetical protein